MRQVYLVGVRGINAVFVEIYISYERIFPCMDKVTLCAAVCVVFEMRYIVYCISHGYMHWKWFSSVMSRMETSMCCFWNGHILLSIWNNTTICNDFNNTMFSFWNATLCLVV